MPLTTTTITTRMNSSGMPPVSRNRICNGDCLSMLKVSLKPLWPTSTTFTSTSASASITARGGVSGMIGPMRGVAGRYRAFGAPGTPCGVVMFSTRSRSGDQVVRLDGAVGVADQPEHQRIAEILRGDQVEAVALLHGVLRDGGEVGSARLGHDAARQIGDRLAGRASCRSACSSRSSGCRSGNVTVGTTPI